MRTFVTTKVGEFRRILQILRNLGQLHILYRIYEIKTYKIQYKRNSRNTLRLRHIQERNGEIYQLYTGGFLIELSYIMPDDW
jgi:hypothetical protein